MIQKNELDNILNGDGLKNLWKRCFQLIKYVTGDVDESKGSIQEQIDGKLDASDIKDVKVDFTSNDTENVTQMPTLPQIKSGSKLSDQLSAISDFCKGVRYLGRLIGSADISEIGDGTDIGTITGAISKLNSDLKMIDMDISNLYPNYIKIEIFQSEEPLTLEANSKIDFFDIPCKMYDGYVPVMASLVYARNDYVISRGCNIRYGSDNICHVRLFPTNFASVEVTCYPMVNVLYIKGNLP